MRFNRLLFAALMLMSACTTATSARAAEVWATDPPYFAKCDGVTDDYAAINAALAASPTVRLPVGNCLISQRLMVSRPISYLYGQGQGATFLTNTSSGNPSIMCGPNASTLGLHNMTVDRNVVATPGGSGIECIKRLDFGDIHDITVQRNWNEAVLGPVGYGRLSNAIFQSSYGFPLLFTNTPTNGGIQWQLSGILAEGGDQSCVAVLASPAPPGTVGAVTGISLGQWTNISTFGCTGYGIAVVGTAAVPIFNVRINGLFAGGDGQHEVYIDSFADGTGSHDLQNVHIELPGSGKTGHALQTDASNTGSGIVVTQNNGAVSINGGWINQTALNGIDLSSAVSAVNNVRVMNSGRAAVAGARSGIAIRAGRATVSNSHSYNTPGGSGQSIGIQIFGGAKAVVTGNDVGSFAGNTGAGIYDASTTSVVKDNILN